jgi:hypothetical protein
MPKFIRLEPSGAAAYRLPPDEDLDALRDQVRSAFEAGRSVEVAVELHDNPLATGILVLNPATSGESFIEIEPGSPDELDEAAKSATRVAFGAPLARSSSLRLLPGGFESISGRRRAWANRQRSSLHLTPRPAAQIIPCHTAQPSQGGEICLGSGYS